MEVLFCTSSIDAEVSRLLSRLASVFDVKFTLVSNVNDLNKIKPAKFDLLISDRNSIIFSRAQLEKFPLGINTHPSLLPSHKGSYPIFWSCIFNDTWGVTLHYLSEQIDQGPVISSVEIDYSEDETFRGLYSRYRAAVGFLLYEFMEHIRSDNDLVSRVTDRKGLTSHFNGNFSHKKRFTESLVKQLPNGWDTNIKTAKRILEKDIESYLARARKLSEIDI